ncbi:MAG TPA: branched-chain amino acid aminotransferase [Bacillaceae bacterium]|nr:branched-chain amino acid aminotransferase [Bacillaceae bacterium]
MLQKQIQQYISSQLNEGKELEVYAEEKVYIEKHGLANDVTLMEKDPTTRFQDAYIERCDKETEETLSEESFTFLQQPINYLKKHKNEFLYLESNWLEVIGVDAITFEVNDVFGTFDVMVGLKLQKKFEAALKEYLRSELQGDEVRFELMFNQNDGVWDLNFPLDYVDGFQEDMSLEEAYRFIYRFLFTLVERIEESRQSAN